MPRSNILVVVVDGLRASALGAYGNTTFPTPALDHFAAESLLFDWCYSPTAELAGIYRALWQSSHPVRSASVGAQLAGFKPGLSLPRLMAERGYQTTLITDEPELVSYADVENFHECVQLAGSHEDTDSPRAGSSSPTELASIFSAVGDLVGRRKSAPKFLWAHARGMYGLWDAPLELQESLLDEGDPPPVELAMAPDFTIDASDDPEEAFRYACAYAAQAIVLDDCWHSLGEALREVSNDDSWLVMVIGARGFSLGEHGRVGGVNSHLYAEQLHVPWLIRYPDARGQLARNGCLASHLDVLPTLLEWIDGGQRSDNACCDGLSTVPLATTVALPWRDALLSASPMGNYSLRTSGWSLLSGSRDVSATLHADASPAKLFVRPDDRWESNDVAKLCEEVVEELSSVAVDVLGRLNRGEPLPPTLLVGELGAIEV